MVDRELGAYADKLYSKLFSAPRAERSLAALVAWFALSSLTSLPKAVEALTYALYYSALSALLVKHFRNVKRMAALLLVMYTPYALSVTIVGVEKALNAELGLAGCMCTVIWGSSSLARAAVYSAAGLFPLLMKGNPSGALSYALGLALSFLTLLLFVAVGGFRALSLVGAFVSAWLSDDYSGLERVASRYSRKTEILSKILVYRTSSSCTAVYVPSVHFGPMRMAGSSKLPYDLIRLSAERGLKAIVLHAPTTHRDNLVRVGDSKKLALLLVSEAERLCRESCGGLLTSVGTARAAGFRLDFVEAPLPLTIISREQGGIDDFNIDVEAPLVLVDAHNEEESAPITEQELSTLSGALNAVNSHLALLGLKDCYFAATVETVDEKLVSDLGLCQPWIALMLVRCGGTTKGLLVVPSNNAEPGAREIVERIGELLGVRLNLITIDDHLCAGMFVGESRRRLSTKGLDELVKSVVAKSLGKLERLEGVAAGVVSFTSEVWNGFYDVVHSAARTLTPLWFTPILAMMLSVLIPMLVA